VGELSRDIDRPRPALQRIKELKEGFPVPGQSVGEDYAWNFLDAFHQFHQRSAMLRPYRSEADPAVAEYCRRDCQHDGASSGSHIAMSVTMRVGVHPSGRHQEPCRVDLPASRTVPAAHTYDTLAFDCQLPVKGPLAGVIDDGAPADDDNRAWRVPSRSTASPGQYNAGRDPRSRYWGSRRSL